MTTYGLQIIEHQFYFAIKLDFFMKFFFANQTILFTPVNRYSCEIFFLLKLMVSAI